jgi:hypothetical protein
MESNQVAIITPEAAKARALAIIEAHKSATSYVRQEDLDTQGMFIPVVAPVPMNPADMHNLSGGQMMPQRHLTDRMAEAAGVNVTSVDVTHPSEYVWVGKAHGTKRMPDGTMREGEGEYSFDAKVYADLDFLRDSKGNYTSEKAQQIHLLDYVKMGHRRASTGARLALIRFFCKCPTSWKRDALPPEIMLCRVDLNTDALLASPDMREAAIAHAVGASNALFGPTTAGERNVTPAPLAITEGAAADEPPAGDDFGDAPEADPAPVVEDETPEAKARSSLVDWAAHPAVAAYRPKSGKVLIDAKTLPAGMATSYATAVEAIMALVERRDATLAQLEAMIRRCAKIGGAS